MHPLVPAVLLRMYRFDPLDLNPESEPPHREFAEAVDRVGRHERHAVVGADDRGQAEFLECALEHMKANFSWVVDNASHVPLRGLEQQLRSDTASFYVAEGSRSEECSCSSSTSSCSSSSRRP